MEHFPLFNIQSQVTPMLLSDEYPISFCLLKIFFYYESKTKFCMSVLKRSRSNEEDHSFEIWYRDGLVLVN